MAKATIHNIPPNCNDIVKQWLSAIGTIESVSLPNPSKLCSATGTVLFSRIKNKQFLDPKETAVSLLPGMNPLFLVFANYVHESESYFCAPEKVHLDNIRSKELKQLDNFISRSHQRPKTTPSTTVTREVIPPPSHQNDVDSDEEMIELLNSVSENRASTPNLPVATSALNTPLDILPPHSNPLDQETALVTPLSSVNPASEIELTTTMEEAPNEVAPTSPSFIQSTVQKEKVLSEQTNVSTLISDSTNEPSPDDLCTLLDLLKPIENLTKQQNNPTKNLDPPPQRSPSPKNPVENNPTSPKSVIAKFMKESPKGITPLSQAIFNISSNLFSALSPPKPSENTNHTQPHSEKDIPNIIKALNRSNKRLNRPSKLPEESPEDKQAKLAKISHNSPKSPDTPYNPPSSRAYRKSTK